LQQVALIHGVIVRDHTFGRLVRQRQKTDTVASHIVQSLIRVAVNQPDKAIRLRTSFAALIVVQAVHSIDEYVGRLYESFPSARFVSGVLSSNLERGFVMTNVMLVAFGLWCWLWPVRRGWPSATRLIWFWVAIELVNGVGHPLWSLRQGGYTPGVATAPLLLMLALVVARQVAARFPSDQGEDP
jgi:hypothetical protein